VSNGVPIVATASPAPARNTLRRVRVVGGLIMSISRVKALRATAEAVVLCVNTQCRSQSSCQPTLGKRTSLYHSVPDSELLALAPSLEQAF